MLRELSENSGVVRAHHEEAGGVSLETFSVPWMPDRRAPGTTVASSSARSVRAAGVPGLNKVRRAPPILRRGESITPMRCGSELPLRRMTAHDSQRALGIGEFRAFHRVGRAGLAGQPVLQDEGRDA